MESRSGPITPEQATGLLDDLTAIVAQASAAIMATHYSTIERRTKDDHSPVTAADERSEDIILAGLSRVLPGVPIIAEESAARAPSRVESSCVIVDPLDGTREFLAGRDEFTVNLGLVTGGRPIGGLISAPAQGLLWRGIVGHGAERMRMRWDEGLKSASERRTIHARTAPEDGLVAAVSRSHLDPQSDSFLARFNVARRYGCGSSIKFCHIAQGDADIYPRFAPTSEWDIAAGCAILTAAGGAITDPAGSALHFADGKSKFLVPGFIAWGDPALARHGKV
jgi:3'(2'), 5'-bisphosphate nucleotidase